MGETHLGKCLRIYDCRDRLRFVRIGLVGMGLEKSPIDMDLGIYRPPAFPPMLHWSVQMYSSNWILTAGAGE